MLSFAHNTRIFLRREPTDMRLGYEGLRNMAASAFARDPFDGSVFVFMNRAKNRCKLLLWDQGGFWLLCRRLEKGTFALPAEGALGMGRVEIDRVELAMLLDGIVAGPMRKNTRFFPGEKPNQVLR